MTRRGERRPRAISGLRVGTGLPWEADAKPGGIGARGRGTRSGSKEAAVTAPVSPEPSDEGVADTTADEAVRALALKASAGDKEAAYEVLGRQAPVETWVQVLRHLARDAEAVDLEVVAHRTLRRPPAVVAAVLELAAAARTPVSAFLARVVAETRQEDALRSAGEALSVELISLWEIDELLAGDDAGGALYALLARPLPEQARIAEHLSDDSSAMNGLLDAARTEYERLQEVARETRWRSGSYRHALRHALADLALIAGAGGRLEDQAFRLLQQRTEEPEANAELLELLPADLRSRYLVWALERSSAESSPTRAQFALNVLTRHPGVVGRDEVARLLVSRDRDVAASAAAHLVASNPNDGSSDRAIADLIDSGDEATQARVIGAIVTESPQRLRLDLWPPDIDTTVVEKALGSTACGERLATTAREASEPDLRVRALRICAQIGETLSEREPLAHELAAAVLSQAHTVDAEVECLLAFDWLRDAAWREVAYAASAVRTQVVGRLLGTDSAPTVWEHLAELHARTAMDDRRELEDLVLQAVANGRLEAEGVVTEHAPELLDALQAQAEQRARVTAEEVGRLRSLIALGDRAAEVELGELVRPLIARAIERSTGNERLISDYQEIGAALAVHDESDAFDDVSLDESLFVETRVALEKAGVELVADRDQITARVAESAAPMQVVRALAIVDQRLARATDPRRQKVEEAALLATAAAAAAGGVGETVLTDLFGRGPLFQAAIALSPRARRALLEATIHHGFVPPQAWREHDVLGEWLIEALGEASATDASGPATGADALVLLQSVERERQDAEDRLRAGRTEARHALVAKAAAALEDLEQTADTYVQLWLGLGRLGVRQIAALGEQMRASELDPSRHELVGGAEGETYVVRSAGVEVDGAVVRRARVEVMR